MVAFLFLPCIGRILLKIDLFMLSTKSIETALLCNFLILVFIVTVVPLVSFFFSCSQMGFPDFHNLSHIIYSYALVADFGGNLEYVKI